MKNFFVLIALVATFVPAFFVVQKVGELEQWQGVLPKGTTDSKYYYARIHEVVDGHPFIGNPYAYEHKDALSPAFFLPDVVSAVPVLLGVPFNIAVLVNVFVWSFIFLMLAFTLLRLLQIQNWWAFSWSIIAYICSYSFMLRPTVMQIVYPVFLLFLIVLLKFLYEPFVRRRIIWLSLTAAVSFYTYTYLAYIVLLTFAFVFIWFLFTHRYKELRALITAGIGTAILLIPFGIYTLLQMGDPNYFETMTRIGLVYTHVPSIEAFFYGRWVAIGLVALGLLWIFFPKKEEGSSARKVFWFATGAGLLSGLFLNVVTGVELTLGVHIGRFIFPWMALVLGAGLYEWYQARPINIGANKIGATYALVAISLVVLSVGVLRSIDRGVDFFGFNNRGETVADVQPYSAPLAWLEANVPEQSVIWANDSIAQYIPIMTRHYTLFAPQTVLHNMSALELEDRYLLSRSFGTLSVDDLWRDLGLYIGAGAFKLQTLAQNQRAWICGVATRFIGPRECLPYTDGITLKGEAYFKTLAQRFEEIKKNQVTILQQFKVKYLIIDRAHDDFGRIFLKKAVYDNGRFVIVPLPL